jgi:N-acetyl-anhydromuramyl-L-alanine amidase AmpD
VTHSTLTTSIRLSDQSSPRNGATIDTYLIHHLAGTNADGAVDAMISGADGGSANYVITNEGDIILVVDETLRAWASGSPDDGGKGAAWDRRSITVEIENETAHPDWRISDAALNAAAALLADLRTRYPIANVLGHRDLHTAEYGWASYSTYCPGPNTVATILDREHPATVEPTPVPLWERIERESDMFLLKINDGANRYGGGTIYALTNAEDRWVEFRTEEAANTLAERFGDAANVTYAEWDAFKLAAGA